MTEEEALKESQRTIKMESQAIANSITRILMVGGPNFVQAILVSLMDANEKIMKTLNMNVEIEFEKKEKT